MARTVLYAEVPGFYAAVARADDPSLAARPVIVGGDPRKRGLVQSASPEAIAAGVVPEMAMSEALQLCPRARAVRTDMARYREVSRRLFACLRRAYPRLEPFGLGAAFFDLAADAPPAAEIAASLHETVGGSLGLPLRTGIASSRFVARLAAEESGSPSHRAVPPGSEAAFLGPLPAIRLDGVGQKTAALLAEQGATRIGEVVALGRDRLEETFGNHGLRIFALASGQDDTPVRAAPHPQSLSREATLDTPTSDLRSLAEQLQDLSRQLAEELELQGLATLKVTLKLRFEDQAKTTRGLTLGAPTTTAAELHAAAERLLTRTQAGARRVRGLGIALGRLLPASESDRQLDLFSSPR